MNLWDELKEVWRYRELLLQLTRRNLRLRYKNSLFGFAWSLITPLAQIAILAYVLKVMMRHGIPNYSAYLFPVLFAWTFFSVAILDACSSLIYDAGVVTKVYFPREILPLASVLANLIHFGIALVVTFLYLMYHRIFPQQVDVLRVCLLLPVIVFTELLLILGLGLIVACLNVLYEDIKYMVSVVLLLMFYFMPILYPVEKVPEHLYQWYMLNPIAAVLVAYQKLLLPPIRIPNMEALPFPGGYLLAALGVSLAVAVGGYLVFNRYKWELVERL